MYLCICKSVSDRQIREAVELGARTIGDLSVRLDVGIECGKCIDSVREYLDTCLATPPTATIPPVAVTTVAEAAPPPTMADVAPQPRPAWFAVDL